jgi:ankyrin repeat protein
VGFVLNLLAKIAPNFALGLAANKGDLETVRRLLDRGADIHSENGSVLGGAAAYGHVEVVKFLLERGADNSLNAIAMALMSACMQGHAATVEALLDNRRKLNASESRFNLFDLKNVTALMLATKLGHLEVMQVLLERGVDVNATDSSGKTAMTYAQERKLVGQERLIDLLIKYGAKQE